MMNGPSAQSGQPPAVTQAIEALVHERLSAGEQVAFQVPSSSMEPGLRKGDRVLAQAVLAERLQIGDIVIVRRDGEWLAHRLIAKERREKGIWVYTKGDNCAYADEPRELSGLVGQIVAIRRAAREMSLVSPPARALAWWLAFLSSRQARLYETRPGFVRSIGLAFLGGLMRASGLLAT